MARHPVIADGWYGDLIAGLPRPEDVSGRRLPRRGPLRGAVLALLSVRAERVAIIRHDPGWRTLLALRALFGRRRKLVVLHFIEPRAPLGPGGAFERWAIRRALLVGHALTDPERVRLSRRYELPKSRFAHVPFALRSAGELPPEPAQPLVVAAGRAECDWETLAAAARGAGWPLVVVCSEADRERAAAVAGELRVELPRDETRALLSRATVSVIAMRESGAAQGHVRLMEAVDAGAAIVASRVAALREYATDGETALLVPPGDPDALRTAVDRLLGDAGDRRRLRETAFARAARRDWNDYLVAIERLVRGEPAAPLSAARARSR